MLTDLLQLSFAKQLNITMFPPLLHQWDDVFLLICRALKTLAVAQWSVKVLFGRPQACSGVFWRAAASSVVPWTPCTMQQCSKKKTEPALVVTLGFFFTCTSLSILCLCLWNHLCQMHTSTWSRHRSKSSSFIDYLSV